MEDRCIVCGEAIPEGRQVCQMCEYKIMEDENDIRVSERAEDKVSEEG